MSELERRAGVFAALADPTRLRIVDLLGVGDLSSSEIGRGLALPSNLVAHHLRVLESAQVIARKKSEFDRRRSYIGLRPDVFDTLAPAAMVRPERVLFVCTANSARSQMAEAIWRGASDVPAASAGIRPGAAVNAGAVAAAARQGLTIDAETRPRHIGEVRERDDLVVTVCDDAHERLLGADDLHWSVSDPAPVGTPAAFDAAFATLAQRVRTLVARLPAVA